MAATEQATGRDAKQSLDGFLSGQPVYGGVPDYQAVISSIQKAYTTSVAAAVMESTASLLTIGKIMDGLRPLQETHLRLKNMPMTLQYPSWGILRQILRTIGEII